MEKRRTYAGIGAALGMLILILDSKTALTGARTGIDLCMRTVVPSLFPFFLLSILLTGSLVGCSVSFLKPIGRLCRIPRGAESILISAFLGGYPVGAQAVAEAYCSGQLSRKEATRMLAFCSNAGPAFLFGMVGSMFPEKSTPWLLWAIHVSGAILTAMMIPASSKSTVQMDSSTTVSVSSALASAIRVMARVCGWVILFRVVTAFLQRWILWLLPTPLQVAVTGILELSNGCCDLWKIPDVRMRFLVCGAILSFGGLCVTMQTMSVVRGLSMKYYYLGKIFQTCIVLLISAAIVYGIWLPCCAALAILAAILRKLQNRGSIPAAVGV